MFYIRADGNQKIGMGHIMRCLTIAEALRDKGEEVCFLTADEEPVQLIEDRGFPARILFTYYDEMDVELPQLMSILMGSQGEAPGRNGGENQQRILVDSYYVTDFYLYNLRLSARVILMDDRKTAVYPCDILVNYNIYGKTLGYEKDYPGTKLLLGCDYMPLRKEFQNADYEVRAQVSHILLTTGGGDGCHMALAMVKRILSSRGSGDEAPVWHIICGPYSTDGEALEEMTKEIPSIQIHRDMTNMSEIMKRCDVAVSAAGSTIYELCSVGVPTIGFFFAENQRLNMEAFGSSTPICNAGDFSVNPEKVLDFIEKEVEILSASLELRKKISMVERMIVDGRGAERLAGEFLK